MRKPSDKPSEFSTCTPVTSECKLPYGVVGNIHDTVSSPAVRENTSQPTVSRSNQKLHLDAYILSFATENLLLLLFVPKLIEYFQFVSRDSRALSQLEMNRTGATYKFKVSFSAFVRKKVVKCMKKYPLSINNDECTYSNSQKMFSTIVNYCDPEIGESVVQHYE